MRLIRALTLLLICLLSLPLQSAGVALPGVSEAATLECGTAAGSLSHHGSTGNCDMADCAVTAACCTAVSAAVIVPLYCGLDRSGLAGLPQRHIFYRSADRAPVFHPPRYQPLS